MNRRTAVLFLAFLFIAQPAAAIALRASTESLDQLSTDLKLVAEAAGWTADDAWAYERAAMELDAIAVKLSTEHPEMFVGSELSNSPYGAPIVYIKGAASARVKEIVASAEVAISVLDDQPYSRDDLYSQRVGIYEALVRAGYTDFSIGADITDRGALRVTVARHVGLSNEPTDVLSLLPSDTRERTDVVVIDATAAILDGTAYGGMQGVSGMNNYCNVGWSVLHSGFGISGITTAGHCTDTAGELDGVKHGTTVHAAAQRGIHMGSWGDIAYLSTSVGEPALFNADGHNDIRDVTATKAAGAIAINEWVCLFAWQSGYRRCTQVAAVEQSCWSSHHVVIMNKETAIGGDSGGGWSYNNRAFGSHTGRCYGDLNVRGDAWMPASYFDEALGVKVKTT